MPHNFSSLVPDHVPLSDCTWQISSWPYYSPHLACESNSQEIDVLIQRNNSIDYTAFWRLCISGPVCHKNGLSRVGNNFQVNFLVRYLVCGPTWPLSRFFSYQFLILFLHPSPHRPRSTLPFSCHINLGSTVTRTCIHRNWHVSLMFFKSLFKGRGIFRS
jgi:hypothetical protein